MSAIADFQSKHGLTADGQIGKNTLNKIKEVLKLQSDEALAHFMGQCAHESGDFAHTSENLNYSAQGLLTTFKKYFTADTAKQYERNPEKIANHVYANRMGNGDEASGDGYKHRGFGFIQLTGKLNQDSFANSIDKPEIKDNPQLIATNYSFESAKYYFDTNNVWKYTTKVDIDSIINVSKIINLGNVNSKSTPVGLDERIKKTQYYYNLIKK